MEKKIEELIKVLDLNKCENIMVLNVGEKTYLADLFIIATILNKPHAEAICKKVEEVNDKFQTSEQNYFHVEGRKEGEWLLIDIGDTIIHLFQPEIRKFYNLEGLWGDAKELNISHLLAD